MLVEIERLIPAELGSLEQVREPVIKSADKACGALMTEFKDQAAAIAVLKEELADLWRYLSAMREAELKAIEPLPYRRVLSEAESDQLWKRLQTRWDVRKSLYWYPLSETSRQAEVIAFHRELWDARDADRLVRRFLDERRIERCIVLREEPPDYEIAASFAPKHYDGSESILTSDFGWLLYASHESSLTVAGDLADYFRHVWPDAAQVAYGGPFHTDDLRGTWK